MRILWMAMVAVGAGILAANSSGDPVKNEPASTAPTTAPSVRSAGWAVEWSADKKRANADTVQVQAIDGAMVVEVTRRGGIGGVTIRLTDGKWPTQIKVRMHGFSSLESFGGGGKKYQVQRRLRQGTLRASAIKDGNSEEVELPQGSKASIKSVAENEIEIEVPALVVEEAGEELNFGWIDAFRR